MKSVNLELAINPTSLGNVSFNLLKEAFLLRNEFDFVLFPERDQIDFSAFSIEQKSEFVEWVNELIFKSGAKFCRENPSLKNWHINGSQYSSSTRPNLLTYYETDSPTETEIKYVNSQNHTFFSSSFAAKLFKDCGCENVSNIGLGFDKDILESVNATPDYYDSEVINFGLMGKFELRKNTQKIIQNWIRKYGDDTKYNLNCLVTNQFLSKEEMESSISRSLFGRRWKNVNILPYFGKSKDVYSFIKYIDIDLTGLSGGEGWNLPAFNSTCLGKWSVVSNCSAHTDWANKENSILVEVSQGEKLAAEDGKFFRKGSHFNQGSFFKIEDEAMIEGMERAEKLARTNNIHGEALREKFTYEKTLKSILEKIS